MGLFAPATHPWLMGLYPRYHSYGEHGILAAVGRKPVLPRWPSAREMVYSVHYLCLPALACTKVYNFTLF